MMSTFTFAKPVKVHALKTLVIFSQHNKKTRYHRDSSRAHGHVYHKKVPLSSPELRGSFLKRRLAISPLTEQFAGSGYKKEEFQVRSVNSVIKLIFDSCQRLYLIFFLFCRNLKPHLYALAHRLFLISCRRPQPQPLPQGII